MYFKTSTDVFFFYVQKSLDFRDMHPPTNCEKFELRFCTLCLSTNNERLEKYALQSFINVFFFRYIQIIERIREISSLQVCIVYRCFYVKLYKKKERTTDKSQDTSTSKEL